MAGYLHKTVQGGARRASAFRGELTTSVTSGKDMLYRPSGDGQHRKSVSILAVRPGSLSYGLLEDHVAMSWTKAITKLLQQQPGMDSVKLQHGNDQSEVADVKVHQEVEVY